MDWHAFKQMVSSHLAVPGGRRLFPLLLGWVAAGAAALLALTLLAMWGTSLGGGGDVYGVSVGTCELQIGSVDGVIVLGVFDTNPGPRWSRRRGVSLLNVQPSVTGNDGFGFAIAGDLYGWAIAVPHLFLVAALAVVPAWWLLVVRNRHAVESWRELGLCRHCGYDLRESPETCPECGQPARRPALYAGGPRLAEVRPGGTA